MVIICGVLFLIAHISAPSLKAEEARAKTPWRIVWFPPNDVLPSWNWVEFGRGDYNTMRIFATDNALPFPDEVKEWKLAVVNAGNPGSKVIIPLENPHTGNSFDYSIWMPGGFRVPGELRDRKIDKLEELGEGTFLCAILGDGKRYSNVAKVTIRHGFIPTGQAFIRLVGVQPYDAIDPVRYIGAWIVGKDPADPNLTRTALRCPTWEIDGVWRIKKGDQNGLIGYVSAGLSLSEVYDVGYDFDRPVPRPEMAINTFHPRIKAFTHAKVRLRITDRIDDFDDLPLTAEQRDYAEGGHDFQKIVRFPRPAKEPAAEFKKYTSDVFDIQTDKDAMTRFDRAFGQ